MDPELRRLVEAYAQRADAADGDGVAALFTADGVLEVFGTPGSDAPTGVRAGTEEIARAIDTLSRYRTTMHVVASATAEVTGDEATGETRCMAHHVSGDDGELTDRVMSIRYADRYRRTPAGWRIARREVHVLLVDDRPVHPA